MHQTLQTFRHLDGIPTEVVLQSFADRVLVLVTQLGKVGNLVQATIPPTTSLLPQPGPDPAQANNIPLPAPPPSIQLMPLLGNAPSEHLQTLHSLYASQIATLIWTSEAESTLDGDRRGVVVGVALRKSMEGEDIDLSDYERRVFYGVMEMVREILGRK
ncbi:hypothetical protein AcW2_004437 [Taiwanofungus camphoratus]|nr:hypothetical protein AcW2_004437 [Antrodia cinnamomea]